MDIIELPVKAIKPYAKNPRKNDKAVEYVANSIRQFGFKVPIVIDCTEWPTETLFPCLIQFAFSHSRKTTIS